MGALKEEQLALRAREERTLRISYEIKSIVIDGPISVIHGSIKHSFNLLGANKIVVPNNEQTLRLLDDLASGVPSKMYQALMKLRDIANKCQPIWCEEGESDL